MHRIREAGSIWLESSGRASLILRVGACSMLLNTQSVILGLIWSSAFRLALRALFVQFFETSSDLAVWSTVVSRLLKTSSASAESILLLL